MSLTDWVNWDKDLFNLFGDKPKLNVTGELKAPPLTKNYSTVGTALDYALRLRVLQLNPELVSAWVDFPLTAEYGIKGNKKRHEFIFGFRQKLTRLSTNPDDVMELLPDCVILAKLESVYRSGMDFPNSDIFSVDSNDVVDLTTLLGISGSDIFTARKKCLLNPTFGKSSGDIGGADADLLLDDCLVDIKTTKYLEFTKDHFRQLMGYYFLNLREHELLGRLNYLGIYYSRYGLLFKFAPQDIAPTLFMDFPDIEKLILIDNTIDTTHIKQVRVECWDAIEESINQYQDDILLNCKQKRKLLKLEANIYNSIGHHFNIHSPEQLRSVLFCELSLPLDSGNDTYYYVTDGTLISLLGEHPAIELLLEYRNLKRGG